MYLSAFEQPLHNNKALKTLDNFGVYNIEFEVLKNSKEKRENILKRIFGWLF